MIDIVRTQSDLMSKWPVNGLKPVVSVIVPAFNHQAYIAQTLNSILMQETDFAFEVVVHDDASTDGTPQIIADYVQKFPGVVRAILRSENIYSKGTKISPQVIPHTVGRYLAFCEGDDFWTDPLKLQKQVKVLEAHPDVFICGHWTTNVDSSGMLTPSQICTGVGRSGLFELEDSLGGTAVHPNTWLYRRLDWLSEPYFDLLNRLPAGDDPSMLIFLTKGKGYCIPEYCSAYRLHTGGSWSSLDSYVKTFKMLQFNVAVFTLVPFKYYPSALLHLSSRSFYFIRDILKLVASKKVTISFRSIKILFKNQKTLHFYHTFIVLGTAALYPFLAIARKVHCLIK